MVGKLYIDGKDAYLEYGVFVEQYGYKELIQFASFKKLDITDWPDEDGIEVDLTEPKLDTRTLKIQFCIVNVRYAEDLFNELAIGSYHTFEFRELGRTYTLRMTSNGTFKSFIRLGKLTISFADDFPEIPTGSHYDLNKSGIRQIGFEMDGKDLSQFGSYVLDGSEDNIRKASNVKENLKITTSNAAGVLYDSFAVRFKSKDVTLKLLIDAPNITEFWNRYNGLFAVILQPESRNFYYAQLGNEYECYYKSMSVSKFDILRSGKVWCEFSVTLVFTKYRPVSQYMFLATQDDDWVVTEDGLSRIIIRPRSGISYLITQSGEFVVTEDDSQIFFNN